MKQFLKKSSLIRGMVRQYRLRTGQPNWTGLLAENSIYQHAQRQASGSGQKILIATNGGGNLAATRIESLLGMALTLRGADIHVLLCDGILPACMECDHEWYPDERKFARRGPSRAHCDACFSPANRMYRQTGVTIHRYSDLVSAEERRAAAVTASEIPVDDIRTYTVDDLAVGEHAVAGALRYYARATLEDSYAEMVLRRYLEAALLTTVATRNLLKVIPLDCAVFHHGIYVPQGLVGEVARKNQVRVVNWHYAYRKKCFIFSHHDTYHHTLMSESTDSWENMPWTSEMETEIMDYLKSRWYGTKDWIVFHKEPQFDLKAIEHEVGIDFSKPCIGMLTNVMWDAQLHYPANAFSNMLDWTLKTIAYFAKRPDLQLLIRVHPAEIRGTLRSRQPIVDEINRAFPSLPSNVFVVPPESHVSTYAAMSECNAVIIYGTKTGVELTSMGIPIIVAGEAWIRDKGITMDATSIPHYFELLDMLPVSERMNESLTQRARKYAYHFFFRRMIPLDFPTVPVSTPPGFTFRLTDIDALLPGYSKGLDTICRGILTGSAFIYLSEQEEHAAVSH